jgi:hypothetical protein
VALALAMLRTVALVAALSLAGRWLLALLAGRQRHRNFAFQLLSVVAQPALTMVRWLLPRSVPDRFIASVALGLMLAAYLGCGVYQRAVCLRDLSQVGCENWAAAHSQRPR